MEVAEEVAEEAAMADCWDTAGRKWLAFVDHAGVYAGWFCLLSPFCHIHSPPEVEPRPGGCRKYGCEKRFLSSPPPTGTWLNPARLPSPQPTVQVYLTQGCSGSKAQGSLQEALGLESKFLALFSAVASLVAVGNIRWEALPLSGVVYSVTVSDDIEYYYHIHQ